MHAAHTLATAIALASLALSLLAASVVAQNTRWGRDKNPDCSGASWCAQWKDNVTGSECQYGYEATYLLDGNVTTEPAKNNYYGIYCERICMKVRLPCSENTMVRS